MARASENSYQSGDISSVVRLSDIEQALGGASGSANNARLDEIAEILRTISSDLSMNLRKASVGNEDVVNEIRNLRVTMVSQPSALADGGVPIGAISSSGVYQPTMPPMMAPLPPSIATVGPGGMPMTAGLADIMAGAGSQLAYDTNRGMMGVGGMGMGLVDRLRAMPGQYQMDWMQRPPWIAAGRPHLPGGIATLKHAIGGPIAAWGTQTPHGYASGEYLGMLHEEATERIADRWPSAAASALKGGLMLAGFAHPAFFGLSMASDIVLDPFKDWVEARALQQEAFRNIGPMAVGGRAMNDGYFGWDRGTRKMLASEFNRYDVENFGAHRRGESTEFFVSAMQAGLLNSSGDPEELAKQVQDYMPIARKFAFAFRTTMSNLGEIMNEFKTILPALKDMETAAEMTLAYNVDPNILKGVGTQLGEFYTQRGDSRVLGGKVGAYGVEFATAASRFGVITPSEIQALGGMPQAGAILGQGLGAPFTGLFSDAFLKWDNGKLVVDKSMLAGGAGGWDYERMLEKTGEVQGGITDDARYRDYKAHRTMLLNQAMRSFGPSDMAEFSLDWYKSGAAKTGLDILDYVKLSTGLDYMQGQQMLNMLGSIPATYRESVTANMWQGMHDYDARSPFKKFFDNLFVSDPLSLPEGRPEEEKLYSPAKLIEKIRERATGPSYAPESAWSVFPEYAAAAKRQNIESSISAKYPVGFSDSNPTHRLARELYNSAAFVPDEVSYMERLRNMPNSFFKGISPAIYRAAFAHSFGGDVDYEKEPNEAKRFLEELQREMGEDLPDNFGLSDLYTMIRMSTLGLNVLSDDRINMGQEQALAPEAFSASRAIAKRIRGGKIDASELKASSAFVDSAAYYRNISNNPKYSDETRNAAAWAAEFIESPAKINDPHLRKAAGAAFDALDPSPGTSRKDFSVFAGGKNVFSQDLFDAAAAAPAGSVEAFYATTAALADMGTNRIVTLPPETELQIARNKKIADEVASKTDSDRSETYQKITAESTSGILDFISKFSPKLAGDISALLPGVLTAD